MLPVAVADDERVPLESIDLFDPGNFSSGSQHAAWHTLRAEAPLWRQRSDDGTEFCSVTRYADVLAVLKDHRRFSSQHGTILAVLGGDSAGGRTINLTDRPAHRALRHATMPLLSQPAMLRLSEQVRARVEAILEPCRGGGTLDLVPLMAQLPLAVVGAVIGVPERAWPDVGEWAMAGVAPLDPRYADGTDDMTLKTAHFELFALFREIVRDRMRSPREDIVSELLACVVNDRKLSFDDVVLNCYSLVMGASTTTPHVASHLLLALANSPDQWRTLRSDPGFTAVAVEEGARWATPTNHLVRRATTTLRLGGGVIEQDELVAAWIGSANRDEKIFDAAYRFDVRRRPNPHLAFGSGIHYCNGAPAARMVLQHTVRTLTDMVEDLAVAGPVQHLHSNFINGITSLPLDLRSSSSRRTPAPVVPASCPHRLRDA